MIEFEEVYVEVEVMIVARVLKIDPSLVQDRMRHKKITSLCELGSDKNVGTMSAFVIFEKQNLRLIDQRG